MILTRCARPAAAHRRCSRCSHRLSARLAWISAKNASKANLVEAALAADVETFVHTATSGVGDHRDVEGLAEGRWKSHETYWENKLATCELVRHAGFAHWTILPATFMDHDMLKPAGFADGRRMVTVVRTDRPLGLIAPEDVGNAAAAAIHDPGRFHRVTLQLAGDLLTLPQIAEILISPRPQAICGRVWYDRTGRRSWPTSRRRTGAHLHERRSAARPARDRPRVRTFTNQLRDLGPPAARSR